MPSIQSFPKRIVLKHPVYGPMNQPSSIQSSRGIPLVYRGVMVIGALCFLLAASTGIWRIALIRGFVLPSIPEWWPPHGHLMVGGFLGGLIIFERIIALRIKWLAWVPYAYMLSAVFLHTGWPAVRLIHCAALAGWIAHRWMAYRAFHKYEKPLVESLAYCTLSSALAHAGGLISAPVVALAALSFPVSVIGVERLEMSLNFRKTGAKITLWILAGWSALWGLSVWFNLLPLSWMGACTLVVLAGMVRYDMALWIKGEAGPLHRFLQRALGAAYVWFLLAAVAMTLSTYLPGAVMKDVLFHLLGLGVVFTMILAHAPLILTAAIGKLPPDRAPIVPFVAFQILTAIRIAADLNVSRWPAAWMWTGWTTGVFHVIAFIVYVAMVFRSSKRPAATT